MAVLKDSPANLKSFYNAIIKGGPLLYGHQFTISFDGPDCPQNLQYETETKDNKVITYYVKSSTIPQVELAESNVAFLSQQFKVPRQVTYGGTWDVTVLIDQNMTHYRSLYDWQNTFASLQLDGGGRKIIPNVQAHVALLDSTLQIEVKRFTLEGVFPSKIPDVNMSYENQANVKDFQCTFTYQYMYDDELGNPLESNAITR